MTCQYFTLVRLSLAALLASSLSAEAAISNEVDLTLSRTRDVASAYSNSFVSLEDSEAGGSGSFLSARVVTPVGDISDVVDLGSGGVAHSVIGGAGTSISNIFLSGQLNSSLVVGNTLRGEVIETITGVIPAARGDLDVNFSFALSRMFLEIWDRSSDGVGGSLFDQVFGQFSYEVALNGERAYRLLFTAGGGRELASLANPVISIFSRDPDAASTLGFIVDDGTGPGDIPRTITFDDLVERNMYLGTVAGTGVGDAETFDVTVSMTAKLLLPPVLDAGGRLNMGDPNALTGSFGAISLETVSGAPLPVPSPATVWLILCGLAALLASRRRACGA